MKMEVEQVLVKRPPVSIYTDGSCLGNPGPGGWAAIIINQEGGERVIRGRKPQTTNNRMELYAVIKALQSLREPARVTVYTDSRYIVDAVNKGWIEGWVRRGWRKSDGDRVKNRELWQTLLSSMHRHDVRFIKVKAHANDHLNNRVDGLAREIASYKR